MVVADLLKAKVPIGIVLLVLLLGWSSNTSKEPIDFCELFAGNAAVSRALRAASLVGHAHDVLYNDRDAMNMLKAAGFLPGPQHD